MDRSHYKYKLPGADIVVAIGHSIILKQYSCGNSFLLCMQLGTGAEQNSDIRYQAAFTYGMLTHSKPSLGR